MDEDEFGRMYAATYQPLLGYALRRCASPEDAADAVAETFVIAWRRAGDIPPGAEARLWLYGVARRVIANQKRGARRHALKVEVLKNELSATPPRRSEPAIANVFDGLPERDREVLALTAWEGLTNAEIATVLGCSYNAVNVRLHRARKRFARALRAAGIEQPPVEGRVGLQRSELA